jgi:hypothetical protein
MTYWTAAAELVALQVAWVVRVPFVEEEDESERLLQNDPPPEEDEEDEGCPVTVTADVQAAENAVSASTRQRGE